MLGLRAASPSRFLPSLEARAGLAEPPLLSDALERMLAEESGRGARLPLFDDPDVPVPAGAVRALTRLIRALRLNRIGPTEYADAGGDQRAADAYRRFEKRREELQLLDVASRVDRLLERGIPSLPLVLDDPSLPHRVSYDLYAAAIAASPSCHVGVSVLLPDGGAGTETAARFELLGLVAHRGAADVWPSVERRVIGGAGMYDEVELVAREILARLRGRAPVRDAESGSERELRAGDILALAPNSTYLTLLHDACTRLGVPVAGKRRVALTDVPLVRALLATIELLASPGDDDEARGLALLATPYVGLSLDEHDVIARELTSRALGAVDSWRRAAHGAGVHFQELAGALPPMKAKLGGERTHRELAGAIVDLATRYRFLRNGRAANLRAHCYDIVRVDQQGWRALEQALDELGTALRLAGRSRLPAHRWLAELRELLSGTYVAADAKPVDGIRLTVTGAGLPPAAHVYAVGWRNGLVPRRTREDPFLTERIRARLTELGAIFPPAEERVAHEHERRERVVRAARSTLTISYPSADAEGGPLLPSFYLEDLGLMRDGRVTGDVRGAGDVTWPLRIAASRGERVARATFLARHEPVNTLGSELPDVRSVLSRLRRSELRSYEGKRHAPQMIHLRGAVRRQAGDLAAVMSASQAKMITHCLYEHFGSHRLGIERLRAPEVDALTVGGVVHAVLADLGRAGFDPALVDTLLRARWDAGVLEVLREEPKAGFERELLAAQLHELVSAESAYLQSAGVRAEYFELGFGRHDRGPEGDDTGDGNVIDGLVLDLPPGARVHHSLLRGSIDRVDVVERNGKRFGVAIDYKSGKGKSYRDEMEEGADFQLPIYCAVLPMLGIEAVGAFYLGIADGKRYGVVREEFADDFAPDAEGKEVKRLSEEDFTSYIGARMDALRGQVTRFASGALEVRPRGDDCAFCELRPVCRIGVFGGGSDGGDLGDA